MTPHDPALQVLVDRVNSARDAGAQLCIRGGGSKDFYGEIPQGDVLDTRVLEGISSYEPTELVVTARCGTALTELETLLAAQGQCLPFEPPHFGNPDLDQRARGATVGGMIAAGLSGPSRAAAGSVRDHVLGATLLNGKGEVMSFGGQVMKNVAGYDVSRLLAGSLGTLGVILEVSLKVLPVAPATLTLRMEMDQARALAQLNAWGGQPLPLNASAWWDGNLILRLRGALAAVQAARTVVGGQVVEPQFASPFWAGLRDHTDEFFTSAHAAVAGGAALWRLSLPASC
jgi:glycolate oxidase FAD binding subunit